MKKLFALIVLSSIFLFIVNPNINSQTFRVVGYVPNWIDVAAFANNFLPVSLGKTRLRTETAAIVACHSVVLLNE